MESIYTVKIRNSKALKLLEDLQELELIELIQNKMQKEKKVSRADKYKGVFSLEDAESFDNHSKVMRKEWENT